jgi:hypothetical protein
MSSRDKWYTWDRNPSEPNFSDWTNLGYGSEKVHRFGDTLDFKLTPFLNNENIKSPDDPTTIVQAYERFNTEAGEIWTNTENKIKLLQESRKKRLNELGVKIAQELKENG